MPTPHIITLSGPSLSGKTELSKSLHNDFGFNFIVSVTTRPMRKQEVDGVDYHFIDEKKYQDLTLIQKTNYNNYNYGVAEDEVLNKSDKPILWVIAPKSIPQVEQICSDRGYLLTKVFVNNPEDVLLGRLFKRFREDLLADVATYVKRLEDMISVERNWINEASYDIIVPDFNEANKQDVINKIAQSILEKSEKNELKKPKLR